MTTKQGQKTDGAANRAAIKELQLSVPFWDQFSKGGTLQDYVEKNHSKERRFL